MKRDNTMLRRSVLRAGLGLGAATAVVVTSMAQDAPKLDKKTIMYQDTPKDGQKCSLCVNFEPPDACKIVEGKISPDGWCGAFAPKQS